MSTLATISDTRESFSSKPLVTFAVIAYNQERFVRAAIDAALLQTYEPLEIILSDDCSSDGTYEIMERMAVAYEGPHRLRLRRNKVNSGLLSHVLLVANEANGEYLVVAAGDDVSFRERTEAIVPNFCNDDVVAISSDDIIIDECGLPVSWDNDRIARRDLCYQKNEGWIHGATAAYRTDFLKSLPMPVAKIYYEDRVFADLIALLGKKSIRLKLPLIKYRYHLSNLSNRISNSNDLQYKEAKKIERWVRTRDSMSYCVEVAQGLIQKGTAVQLSVYKRLRGECKYFFYISNWKQNGPWGRMKLLYFGLRYGRVTSSLSRVFGEAVFRAFRGVLRDR
jgi:glycosyltransferase involved in cell wall biosynthesis